MGKYALTLPIRCTLVVNQELRKRKTGSNRTINLATQSLTPTLILPPLQSLLQHQLLLPLRHDLQFLARQQLLYPLFYLLRPSLQYRLRAGYPEEVTTIESVPSVSNNTGDSPSI
jgi:hypothetical protein